VPSKGWKQGGGGVSKVSVSGRNAYRKVLTSLYSGVNLGTRFSSADVLEPCSTEMRRL
jgi:hypothetical protein